MSKAVSLARDKPTLFWYTARARFPAPGAGILSPDLGCEAPAQPAVLVTILVANTLAKPRPSVTLGNAVGATILSAPYLHRWMPMLSPSDCHLAGNRILGPSLAMAGRPRCRKSGQR